jgi:hypothetical protein
MASTEQKLEALRSPDWATRKRAARALGGTPGEAVTHALVAALESDDTAVTLAAVESLLRRDEPQTTDLIWAAIQQMDDDLSAHTWSYLEFHPGHHITREIDARWSEQELGPDPKSRLRDYGDLPDDP